MRGDPLTDDEIKFAKSGRKLGRTWRTIAESLDRNWETVKRAVHPEFAEFRRTQIREARARRPGAVGAGTNPMIAQRRPEIPDVVLNERAACFARPMTLTAIILGDPLPGRSALDKRGARP